MTTDSARKAMLGLLKMAQDKNASDLHIIEGRPPVFRVDGDIVFMEAQPLDNEDTKALIYSILNETQLKKFETDWELNLSMTLDEIGRFRIAVYYQKSTVEASVRIVPREIPSIEQLKLPEIVKELARKPNGLILITGPTSSGKTTTFNSIIDFINKERRAKIITVEDPIEYVHSHKKSIVIQQEVYADVKSFSSALHHILRQNPDVIGIGEMRDTETIAATLTAAETGHLVIATLHTNDSVQTISRIIDVFPPHQQEQVRIQLSSTLQGILSQMLLQQVGGGRALAVEILTAVQAVRHQIRESKIAGIYSSIQTGLNQGMQTMDRCIRNLYQEGVISYATAMSKIKDPKELTPGK